MLDYIRANAQSWGVKVAFGLIIIVFVFWGVGNFQATDPGVIIKVNSTPIMVQDFRLRFAPELDALRMQYPDMTQEQLASIEPALRQQVLQTLIVETLLLEEGRRSGVVVTPQELRRNIEQIQAFQNDNGKFDPETYQRILKAQGTMPGVFEEQLRNDLLRRKFQQITAGPAFVSVEQGKNLFLFQGEQRVLEAVVFKTADYTAKAVPTPAEVTAYYDGHKAEFEVPPMADVQFVPVSAESLSQPAAVSKADVAEYYNKNTARYARPEQVHARHILVLASKEADKATDDAAKAKIEEAAAAIKGGKDFAEVAKAVSQDGSAQDGGELGWFERGQMVPAFEQVAFGMQAGEMSGPVRTDFGWHLIKVEGHTPAGTLPLAEVENDIAAQIALERAMPKVQEVLDNLLIAVINGQNLTDAAAKYSLKVDTTGMQSEADLAQVLSLKAADVKTLMAAPVGKTLDTAFSTGDGYVIAHVLAATPATTRPLDEVRDGIVTQLIDEKALKLAQEAATAARTTITGDTLPEALKASLVTTAPMDRSGYAADFASRNASLGEAVFAAEGNGWLPVAYDVDAGAALIRVKETIVPDMSMWGNIEAQLMRALTGARQERQYVSFLDSLMRTATLTEVNLGLITPPQQGQPEQQ